MQNQRLWGKIVYIGTFGDPNRVNKGNLYAVSEEKIVTFKHLRI